MASLLSVAGLLSVVFVAVRRVSGHSTDGLLAAGAVLAVPEGLRALLSPHADALAAALSVADQTVTVRYFSLRTMRGARRYSAEILLAAGDRVILDDDSLANVEARVNVLIPATLHSRALTHKPTAA